MVNLTLNHKKKKTNLQNHFDGAMTKRKREQDDIDNTLSQSSIERIIEPDYAELNEEEKKETIVLYREEKKYVIFLFDHIFLRSSGVANDVN